MVTVKVLLSAANKTSEMVGAVLSPLPEKPAKEFVINKLVHKYDEL